jgi:hypothetical protein
MIIADAGPMFLLLRLLPHSSYKSPQINAFPGVAHRCVAPLPRAAPRRDPSLPARWLLYCQALVGGAVGHNKSHKRIQLQQWTWGIPCAAVACLAGLISEGLLYRTAKTSWLSYAGMPIILALIGLGHHPCRDTYVFVQLARCGSMAALIVVLDRPARSLPLLREVRVDERLHQWPPRERFKERMGAAPG